MKKLIALFICLCLMAGIVPVVAESAASHEITSNDFSFYSDSNDTTNSQSINIVQQSNRL